MNTNSEIILDAEAISYILINWYISPKEGVLCGDVVEIGDDSRRSIKFLQEIPISSIVSKTNRKYVATNRKCYYELDNIDRYFSRNEKEMYNYISSLPSMKKNNK